MKTHKSKSPGTLGQRVIGMIATILCASSVPPVIADPILQSDTTAIGTHPDYNSGFSGFWRTGYDYAVLTDGYHTYINAPHQLGTIYFRGGNTGNGSFTSNDNQKWQSRMWLTSKGALFVSGSIYSRAVLIDSDARVKKDIADFKLGLAALEKIHVVKFKYNGLAGTDDGGKEHVGVVAQEIEKIFPFMVSSRQEKLRETDKDATDIKSINPSAFTYLLVNAVQELGRQNKDLASQNAEQGRQLTEQNKKLSELAQQNKNLAELAEQNKLVVAVVCKDHPTEAFCTRSVAIAK